MRRQYRKRSYLGTTIWVVGIVGLVGWSAWEFGWFGNRLEEPPMPEDDPLVLLDDLDKPPSSGESASSSAFDEQNAIEANNAPPWEGAEPDFLAEQADEPDVGAPDFAAAPDFESSTDRRGAAPRAVLTDAWAGSDRPHAPQPGRPYVPMVSPELRQRQRGPRRSVQTADYARPAPPENPPRDASSLANPGTANAGTSGVVLASNETQPAVDRPRPAGPAAAQPDAAVDSNAAVEKKVAEADLLLQAGEYLEAHRELSSIYWSHPEWRSAIQERIDTTAKSIYFSPQPHYMEPYVVQSGDQLSKIAVRYQVPWAYLTRLNRVDPRRIRPGQKLKVIKGPFDALIDLSEFRIYVHAHGYYVRQYPAGIGKDGTTPVGRFKVLKKLINPTYYGPEGEVIDRDDPSNPLGERWIDLGDSYGIHGTIDPTSIGRAESRGCIRMLNSDVEEAFDLLGVGSEVVIRR